jgi:hypothetical protein
MPSKLYGNSREKRKDNRRYARADRKIKKAEGKNREERVKKKYGYNYKAAKEAGLKPDESKHWPSRNPKTGEILKGRKHPTIYKTKRAEKKLGYKIKKKKGTLYSKLKSNNP